MDIGNHRSDVPGAVGGLGWVGELDGFEICIHGWVEVHGIALVERVDLSACRNLDIWVCKDIFAEGGIEGIAVHALTGGEDQVCG